MTQLDKLRSMTVEEVARDRLQYVKAGPLGFVKGDFGYNIYFGSFEKYNHKQAYAEALRLEIAWLESETEGEK